jgi:hypothetical protein
MKKKNLLIVAIVPLLLTITSLTGCIGPTAITTWGWDHVDTEGTEVRIWGHLTLSENFHNWNAWFVYDTEAHENWENYDNRVEADNYDSLNYFSVNVGNLSRTTEYHYRAVGEYQGQQSLIRVGADAKFIPGGPRVWTSNASGIEITSATLNGHLTHLGGASSCDVWFEYGDDENYLGEETEPQTMTSTGEFSAEIIGLDSCTTYYFRAIAENDADTWVGFKFTVTPGMPVVETYLPTDVTTDSAVYQGKLWHLGGPTSSEVWFEYGDDNPNNLDESTSLQTMNMTGNFVAAVSGLKSGTTYWVRAVSDNGICESKGEIKEFKTYSALDQQKNEEIQKNTVTNNLKSQTYEWLKKNFNNEAFEDLAEKYPQIEQAISKFFNTQII